MPDGKLETKIKIPVSAVAEYLYCPRIFYYRMVEGAEEENHFLVEGRLQEEMREVLRGEIKEYIPFAVR